MKGVSVHDVMGVNWNQLIKENSSLYFIVFAGLFFLQHIVLTHRVSGNGCRHASEDL